MRRMMTCRDCGSMFESRPAPPRGAERCRLCRAELAALLARRADQLEVRELALLRLSPGALAELADALAGVRDGVPA